MGKLGIFREFFGYMLERKKWWLLPIISLLLLSGILMVATQSNAVTTLIYAIF